MDTNKLQAQAGAVMLIPSLEPDHRLPDYADRLLESGFGRIVIVDDGSSEKYQPIFNEIAAKPGCTVLHHDVNHGKGVALKTGYTWIRDNCPDCVSVITADADGQHTVKDCIALAEAVATRERALYLGSRDFTLPHVPERSRKGNHITSAVFKALYGVYLPDTQTGLRAFRRSDLQLMIDVPGERFEYEMNVLIDCTRKNLPMIPVTIETVYENDNEGTHFHPIRDSWRIYKVILAGFFRYVGASLASFLLDELFAWLFCDVFKWSNLVGNPLARVISGVFNFLVNRSLVFKSKQNIKRTAVRYAIVWLGVLILDTLLIQWLCDLFHSTALRWVFKIVCDLSLYCVTYRLQQGWVFKEESDVK